MNAKLKKIFPIIGLTIISMAAIGTGAYFMSIGIGQKKEDDISYVESFDWSNYKNAQNFSQKNSFKVSFVYSLEYVSNGTAWSFYFDTTTSSSEIYWYLITNFHVVNDAVAYNNGSITSNDLFFQHNTEIIRGFELLDTNNGKYRSLIAKNYWSGLNTPLISINKVNVITDNSKIYNNNDDLNLFSNSASNMNQYYNLDMSVIKIAMNKTIYQNNYNNIFSKIANPYQLWLNNKDQMNLSFKNVATTYISGNPRSQEKLVAQVVNDFSFNNSYQYLNVADSGDLNSTERLKKLYFASAYSNDYYSNWILTAGASGSAVYQLSENFDFNDMSYNWLNQMPVGIYWGGIENTSNKIFKPAFIPLVTSRYNFYENFSNFLSSQYNN